MDLTPVVYFEDAGSHAAGCLPGDRAGGAGAARGRAHLLLLEPPNR